jgi:high-affinity nickel-transport protein
MHSTALLGGQCPRLRRRIVTEGIMQANLNTSISSAGPRRSRHLWVLLPLLAANLLAWGWALSAFADHPAQLGTALLAYLLGLRHAVDADHIAAIDNTVRKLMQENQRPLCVGFSFPSATPCW